jgi:peroxiredoxin Q/BCP
MKKDFKKFRDRKAQVAVIVPHGAQKTKSYWDKENLPFPGIPDPDGRLGKLYDQEWNLIKLGRMPALFIIDRKGVIRFSQYAKNMADIPENMALLHILDGLNQSWRNQSHP